MSMLHLAQTVADARPGLAFAYILGQIGLIGAVVYGLVRLVSRIQRNTLPPASPNYPAPQGYPPTYSAPPNWPSHTPPNGTPGHTPPWLPQSIPPADPR